MVDLLNGGVAVRQEFKSSIVEIRDVSVLPNGNTYETAVRPADADSIRTLRGRVKAALSHLLARIDPPLLCVYPNQAEFDCRGTRLTTRTAIGSLESDQMIVIVPDEQALGCPPSRQPKTLLSRADAMEPLAHQQENPKFIELTTATNADPLVLYRRQSVEDLFQFLHEEVIGRGAYGWILSPPGSGKSTTAAAVALLLNHSEWTVIWIHLSLMVSPCCVRSARQTKRTTKLQSRWLEDGSLAEVLNEAEASKKHIVFVDGLTVQILKKRSPARFGLKRTNRTTGVFLSPVWPRAKERVLKTIGCCRSRNSSYCPGTEEYLEAVSTTSSFTV